MGLKTLNVIMIFLCLVSTGIITSGVFQIPDWQTRTVYTTNGMIIGALLMLNILRLTYLRGR